MNSARGITVGDDDDYDNYGDILNNDTINVYSENSQAYGIEVEGYNYGRIITKDMDVESNGTSYAVGIEVEYDNGEDGYNPNEVGYIENTGTMTVTAHNSDAYGIFSEENDDNYGIIKNSGTITVTSDTDNAYGILFGDNYRDIINDTESSITVTADEDAYGIYVSGDNDGTTEDNAQIINRGKITVASIAGDIVNSESTAAGIYVGGDNYDDGIISNDGGDINVTSNKEGTEVFGIFVDAENDGDIENINGATITATSTADNAYGIFIYDDNDGTIENDGAITAAAADGYNAYGIYIGNDEWNSDGEIIISEDGSITATIINDEGEHVADHAAYSIWMSDAGDHLVTNNGVLSGNIKVYNELTNSGNIILPWNANYNDSNYAYIEDLTVTDGGILTIGLYNTADNGSDLDVSYSQLSTYTSTFEDGATIHVDVQSDAAHQLLIDGETLYEVVYGSRGLTAEDGSSVNVDLETLNVTDNSDLLDFTAWTDGNQYGDGILNLNASVNAIDGTNALLSAQVGIAQMNNAILNDTRKRIVQVSDNASDANGTNSGDVVAGSNGFWLKPFYAYGNQAAKDGITGFDMDSYGIGVGFDNQVGQNSRFGLGFYYTNADIQVQDNMAQVDAENFTVVAYGSTALNEAKTTKFIYQLGYSSQNNDARRTIDSVDTRAVNGMADIFSEYDSSVASLDLGIMGEYKMSQGTTANPLIEARLRRFETSDFTESSAQTDATYSIDQSVNYETTVAVGSMFETKMSEDSKFVTDLRVGYDFSHDDGVIHAQYAVDAFGAYAQDIATIDNGGLVYNVGAMYQTEGDNVVFDLSYDLEGRGADFQNHMFSAKAVFKF
jgi:outer membrane autotransporter protein